MFSNLFRKSTPSPLSINVLMSHGSYEMVSINKAEFTGNFARSPDGTWGVGWQENQSSRNSSAKNSPSMGRYMLFDIARGIKVLEGEMPRPRMATVADNGTFAIEDWGRPGELEGVFNVISVDGRSLIKKYFDANIFGSWISGNGAIAVCQTANNPKGKFGNRLTAFDVRSGEEYFSISPRDWGNSYRLGNGDGVFIIAVTNGGTIGYGVDGTATII